MFDPPPGNEDLLAQVEEIERLNVGVEANDPNPPSVGYRFVEIAGENIEVRVPNPKSLAVFTAAISKHASKNLQNDMIGLFVRRHVSTKSYEHMIYRMMDPDDEFEMRHFGELMRSIATVGTARPTGPSRT